MTPNELANRIKKLKGETIEITPEMGQLLERHSYFIPAYQYGEVVTEKVSRYNRNTNKFKTIITRYIAENIQRGEIGKIYRKKIIVLGLINGN